MTCMSKMPPLEHNMQASYDFKVVASCRFEVFDSEGSRPLRSAQKTCRIMPHHVHRSKLNPTNPMSEGQGSLKRESCTAVLVASTSAQGTVALFCSVSALAAKPCTESSCLLGHVAVLERTQPTHIKPLFSMVHVAFTGNPSKLQERMSECRCEAMADAFAFRQVQHVHRLGGKAFPCKSSIV